MSAQPEALRLADVGRLSRHDEWHRQTDAELRRLHAENERCRDICAATSERWRQDAEAWEAQRDALRQIVDEQAEDEGLWFRPETAAEAYLQQELRRLHAAVEEPT